ncbi:hypothetical protein ACH3XW_46205 [Acanthocheilonema viteae]
MGSQQSQLLNRQEQQPGRSRQHCHFHHLLGKRASIRHLERSFNEQNLSFVLAIISLPTYAYTGCCSIITLNYGE